jgi:hypothetical protein
MNLDSWLNEMINRVKTIEKECLKNGMSEGVMDLLIDRAITPSGLWDPERTITDDHSSITDIATEFGLTIDGEILKIQGERIPTEKFKELVKRLEAKGYEYNKGKALFRPKWNGVKNSEKRVKQ